MTSDSRAVLIRRSSTYAVLAVLYAAGIFVLSSLPGETFGELGRLRAFLFNLAHAPLFGGLSFLIAQALVVRDRELPGLSWKRVAAAVTITLVYAGCDEWHQSFVAGRSPDPADVVTDLAGAVGAALVVRLLTQGEKNPGRYAGILVLPLALAVASSLLMAA